MKSLLIAIALILSVNRGQAQLSEIVIDSTLSKADIFARTLIWVANTWESSEGVIDLKDEQNGIIIIKGAMSAAPRGLGTRANGNTMTRITVQIKDGKAKIEFEDTYFKWAGGMLWEYSIKKKSNGRTYDTWHDEVDREAMKLFSTFRKTITTYRTDF